MAPAEPNTNAFTRRGLGPAALAARMVHLSWPAFLAVFLLSLLAYVGVLVFLMLWDNTLTWTWAPASSASAPTTASAPGDPDAASPPGMPPFTSELHERTLADVWAEWHARALDGWFGPAEAVLVLGLTLGPLAVTLLAWLMLPFVHGSGSAWLSYQRAYRAAATILWPAAVLTLGCGALFISLDHALAPSALMSALQFMPETALFLSAGVAAVVLAVCLGRAARGVGCGERLVLPLRCEGCGYDLTHQPAEGRCPECGLVLAASCNKSASRPGSPWALRRTPARWLATSWVVLCQPRAFYRALQLRTPPGADLGFSTWHYVLIACGAAVWAGVMLAVLSLKEGPPPAGVLPTILVYGCSVILWGTLGCWLGHRALAALVVSWWLSAAADGRLPDGRWAAKVVTYETVFLWVFCALWGVVIGSYVVRGPWLSHWIVPDARPVFFVLGLPLEAWAIVMTTVALGAVWLWRYEVAYRAIRWSNF